MNMTDRITYDSRELIRMLETQLDRLNKFRFDSGYRQLLGDRIIEKLSRWDADIRKQKDMPLTVVVCGEFKRGKSSLINALLGEDVVTTNITTETITTNRISYGAHANEIILSGGRRVRLTDDELKKDALAKILSELPERATRLELRRPIDVLKEMTIIDTPGLGDAMQDYAEDVSEALQQADAVIYVFSVAYPLSVQEKVFIKSAIKPQRYTDLFIVGNSADMIESPEDCARVKNTVSARLADILPGESPLLLSALDERCRQLGTRRPNPEMSGYLEESFVSFRQQIAALLEEKRDCVIPDRIERLINAMIADLQDDIESLRAGLTMDTEEISERLEELRAAKQENIDRNTELFETIEEKAVEYRGECIEALELFITAMEEDTSCLASLPTEDVRKYYTLFCVETLQQAITACSEYFVTALYDELDDISADITKKLSFSTMDTVPRFKMAMQSKTWTRGDNIALVTSYAGLSSIPLVSNIVGFIAGSMRDKEIENKMPDVISEIRSQYPALRISALNSLTAAFKELTEKAKKQVSEYFDDQTRELEQKADESAAVARRDAESKAEIAAALGELTDTIVSVKEALLTAPQEA